MKTIFLLAALAAAGLSSSVLASTVSFASLHNPNATSFGSAEAYRTNWNTLAANGAATAEIQTWDSTNPVPTNNQSLVSGGSQNIAFKFQVDFCVDASQDGSLFNFRIAPDFGYGGAVFLDGVAIALNSNDLWWGGNWANASEIFSFSANLAAGHHSIEVYGQEPCCDGATSGQYAVNGSDWKSFGQNDGLNCDVPEAGANLALLAGGFGLMVAGRRLRRAKR